MLKTLYTFVNIGKTRKDLWIKSVRKCSIETNSIPENNNKIKFTNREDHILNTLNTSDLNVLTRYIQESYAEKIILHRTTNGPFKSLNDLTSIKDMKLDVLNGLFISHIDKVQLLKLKRSMLFPRTKIKMVPAEILGLHVGCNIISWAVVTFDFRVLYLDYIIWSDRTKKINSYDLINLAPTVAKMLPPSSSYVIEELPLLDKAYNKHLIRQLMTAVMSCIKIMDDPRRDESLLLDNQFYMLRPQISAYFFNLILDKEVVASKYITGMISHNSKIENKAFQHIYINDKLKSNFVNLRPEQQEQIGWSLLKALTCMYLLKFFKEE